MGKLLRAVEAAIRLAISPKTVYKLAAEGFLPSVRFAGSVRFDEDDIEAFIQRNKVGNT